MKRSWRGATGGAFLLVLITGLGVSCARESTAPARTIDPAARTVQQRLDDLRATYGFVGKYHADALAFAGDRLAKANASRLPLAQRCAIASAALKEFHARTVKAPIPKDIRSRFLTEGVCEPPTAATNMAVALPGTGALRFEELSPPAQSFLYQVENVAETATSSAEVNQRIAVIEASAAAELAYEEAGAVIALGGVATGSAQYWESNPTGWATEMIYLEYSHAPSQGKSAPATLRMSVYPDLGTVLKADVGGALRSIMMDWYAGPISWQKAAVQGTIASMIAALLT